MSTNAPDTLTGTALLREKLCAILQLSLIEQNAEFEHALTNMVSDAQLNFSSHHYQEILEREAEAEELRYAAFYCLTIRYRADRNLSLLADLFSIYEPLFQSHPTFNHLKTLYLLEKERNSEDSYSLLLQSSYRDCHDFAANSGFVHLFADTAATIFEQLSPEQLPLFFDEWYGKALDAVNTAIRIKPSYAKYYCTKARLLSFSDRYKESFALIDTAIDMEDSHRSDYVSRINYYERHRLEISNRNQQQLLRERIEGLNKQFLIYEEKMQESNIKMIELLGLFAGVISFVIGSIQIAANQPLAMAARLIVVLMGSTTCVCAAFTFVVHRASRDTLIRSGLMLLLGLLAVGGGLLLCSFA